MNTNIKKKGRMALAWLIIITMVIATMSTPFAYAKPEPIPPQPTPKTPGITFDLSTFGKLEVTKDPEEEKFQTFRISDEVDFIVFKQGSLGSTTQVSHLWTPSPIDTTLQPNLKQDIVDQIVYWANYGPEDVKDGSLKELLLSHLAYISGFGAVGTYEYMITHDEVTNEFVITVDKNKLSHMTFGSYDEEETELGSIEWTKIDSTDEGALTGSEWTLTKPDGSTMEVIDNGANDANPLIGALKVIDLELGDYTLIESKAPRGYKLNTTTFEAMVSEDDLSFEIGAIENARRAGTLTWTKIDATDESPLAGSEWTLTKPDGSTMEVIDNGAKDSDPVLGALKVTGLEWGAYTLVESKAPRGYKLNTNVFEATVSSDERSIDLGAIENARRPGTLTWTKIDATDESPLAGSEWTLTKPDGSTMTVIDNGAKDTDSVLGALKVTGLQWGDYTLTESKAPAGYKLITTTFEGTVSADDRSIDLGAIENSPLTGSISVTKKVVVDTDNPEFTLTKTFYAGLFTKTEAGMKLVQLGEGDDAVDAIAILEVVKSKPVTNDEAFVGLDLNQAYYVFETDEFGNIIEIDDDGYIKPKSTTGWYAIEYAGEGNAIELNLDALTGSETITNYFSDFGGAFDPAIEVIKKVTQDGKPATSTLTFYVGLFSDKGLTNLIAVKPVTTTVNASFAYEKDGVTPLKTNVIYYIAETDKDGKPLAGTAKELGFQISINSVTNNKAEVVLVEDGTTVTIVNDYKKTEEFPLTGDNSNMNLWIFLAMLGVAGAIAPFAFRKKEETND